MKTSDVYVSIDVETDGPCPLLNSLLSLGAAAFTVDGRALGTFAVNLDLWPTATPDPDTMTWWATKPEAWAACRTETVPPLTAMTRFEDWLAALGEPPVAVCYPAGFDFTFVKVYFHATVGRCPLSFQAIDLKTYAMALLGTSFKGTTKRVMPREWFGPAKHTHVAVDDAVEQGELFFAMRRWAEAPSRRAALTGGGR